MQFRSRRGTVTAVDHLNFTVDEGEILGVVGDRVTKTLVMVDDDIVNIAVDQVQAAADRLTRAQAVGLAVPDSPDNSVVCHANRLGGGHQDV